MKKIVKFEFEGKIVTVEVERNGDVLSIQKDGKNYSVILKSDEIIIPEKNIKQPSKETIVQKEIKKPVPIVSQSNSPGDIVAPMTGTIREISVIVGKEVTEGEVVFIMEAMKMDIEVPTAIKGTIEVVNVNVGDSVTEGQLLAKIN